MHARMTAYGPMLLIRTKFEMSVGCPAKRGRRRLQCTADVRHVISVFPIVTAAQPSLARVPDSAEFVTRIQFSVANNTFTENSTLKS